MNKWSWIYLFVACCLIGVVVGQDLKVFEQERVGINTNRPNFALDVFQSDIAKPAIGISYASGAGNTLAFQIRAGGAAGSTNIQMFVPGSVYFASGLGINTNNVGGPGSGFNMFNQLFQLNSEHQAGIIYAGTNGNVGIGTAAPTAPLSVQHASDARVNLLIGATERGFLSYSNAQNILTMDSDGDVVVAPNNSALITAAATGNVGIGTASPVLKLDLRGGFYQVMPTASSADIHLVDDGGGRKVELLTDAEGDAQLDLRNSAGAAGIVRVSAGGSSYLNGGNVGIGTTAPGEKLDVAGNVVLSGSGRTLSFGGGQSVQDAGGGILNLSGQLKFSSETASSLNALDSANEVVPVGTWDGTTLGLTNVQFRGTSTMFSGAVTATNGLASFATNIVASINAAGYTNNPTAPGTGTGVNMNVHVVGTSGTIVFYNRSGVNGQTVCGTPLWTNTTAIPIGMVIPVPVNCGIQIVSGVGVTMQAYAQ